MKKPAAVRQYTTTCRRNAQSWNRSTVRAQWSRRPAACRRSTGSVSGTPASTPTTITAPNRASTTNTARQVLNDSSTPPSAGAMTGPRNVMEASVPNLAAAAGPS